MVGIFSQLSYETIVRGPFKVHKNLILGFEKLKIDYQINRVGELNGCLNSHRSFGNLPTNTLMGPNLVVNPPDDKELFKNYKNILVPSSVVMNNYLVFEESKDTNFFVHPTGIDTEYWDINKNVVKDCLIYIKGRSENELNLVCENLDSLNLKYDIIRYGQYSESDLKEKLKGVRFCVLLTRTESQGIAYMEILSTNTPCFVYNFVYDDGLLLGVSTPYFSDLCGMIYNGDIQNSKNELEKFIGSLTNYNPREYITNEFSLEKSSQKYLNFLINSHQL